MVPLSLLALSACGTARVAHHDALGGRLELLGAYMPAMSAARVAVAEACNGHAHVQEQGKALEYRCEAGGPVAFASAGH